MYLETSDGAAKRKGLLVMHCAELRKSIFQLSALSSRGALESLKR